MSTLRIWTPLLTEVLRYSALNTVNAVKICNGIMFDFYLGLPHVLLYTAHQSLPFTQNTARLQRSRATKVIYDSCIMNLHGCGCHHTMALVTRYNQQRSQTTWSYHSSSTHKKVYYSQASKYACGYSFIVVCYNIHLRLTIGILILIS